MICDQMIRIELHTHTHHSFDAFTSIAELIRECKRKKIDAIAITDHDVMHLTKNEITQFQENGITLVYGCEMTTDKGAHIIGLFIEHERCGLTLRKTIELILDQKGIVYIPHPFKPGSGIFDIYDQKDPEIIFSLESADLMELYNGGWNSNGYHNRIRDIAGAFDITLVAGSDSHKAWQVGRYITEFYFNDEQNLKDILSTQKSKLLEVENAQAIKREKDDTKLIRKIQLSNVYQSVIQKVPFRIKRVLKKSAYQKKMRRYEHTLNTKPKYFEITTDFK